MTVRTDRPEVPMLPFRGCTALAAGEVQFCFPGLFQTELNRFEDYKAGVKMEDCLSVFQTGYSESVINPA